MKPWKQVYALVHPGQQPSWTSPEGAVEWLHSDWAAIEPVLVDVLRGKYEEVPWTSGLLLARVKSSHPVEEVLLERLLGWRQAHSDPCGKTEKEGLIYSGVIEILARSGDLRVRPMAEEMAQRCEVPLVIERCLNSLRQVGNQESVAKLNGVTSRARYPHIDLLCQDVEQSIQARLEKRPVAQEAQEALKATAEGFLAGVRAKDIGRIERHLARDMARGQDADDWREFLGSAELTGYLEHLEAAIAGHCAFDVNVDGTMAVLNLRENLSFVCVREGGIWKVAWIGPTAGAKGTPFSSERIDGS